jgi:hypothetical protein
MLLKELGIVSYAPAARGVEDVAGTQGNSAVRQCQDRRIWHIGGRNVEPNPYIGFRVRVQWLRPWGGKPAGFTLEGKLMATFAVNGGRTLLGEILLDNGRRETAPWSRNYLAVEVVQ